MTGWVVRQFKGVAPRITPRQLSDNMAAACANVNFKHGSLVPRKANTAVLTLPKSGTIKTVHRFGQDVSSDTQYWFHWATEGVSVVRGPVEFRQGRRVDHSENRHAVADKRDVDRELGTAGGELACAVERIDQKECVLGVDHLAGAGSFFRDDGNTRG